MNAAWWLVTFIGVGLALVFFLGALLTMVIGAISSFYERHYIDGIMYTVIALICYWLFVELNDNFIYLLRTAVRRVGA